MSHKKTIQIFIALALTLILPFSFGGSLFAEDAPSHYTSLSCATAIPGSLAMNVGYSRNITVTPTPLSITGGDTIVFESEDPSVATVEADSTGLVGSVTGVSSGSTNIDVYAVVNGVKQTSEALSKKNPVRVTNHLNSITVNPGSASLQVGDGARDTVQLTYAYSPNPTDSDTTVTWSSSDTAIAAVDADGLVTAVSEGSATITAKSNYSEYIFGTCSIQVQSNPIIGITVSPAATPVEVTGTVQLSSTLILKDPNFETTDDQTVNWTSSDDTIATVDSNGLVTTHSTGQVEIIAASKARPSVAASSLINVTRDLKKISIKPSTTIHKGNTEQLAVTYDPEDTTVDKSITWSSLNSAVASVDENGKVTAVGIGTTTITAASNSKPEIKASHVVTVDNPIQSIDFGMNPDKDTIDLGKSARMMAVLTPADTSDTSYIWSISGPASIDENGIVTLSSSAKGGDVINITITSDADPKITVTKKLTVVERPLAESERDIVDSDGGSVAGATIVFDSAAPRTFSLKTDTTDDVTVTWISSDSNIASVDRNGTVTPLANGTVTITATITDTKGNSYTQSFYADIQAFKTTSAGGVSNTISSARNASSNTSAATVKTASTSTGDQTNVLPTLLAIIVSMTIFTTALAYRKKQITDM